MSSRNNINRPRTTNQAQSGNSDPSTFSQVDMLKVLDTYKRSVDYYNSYGLEHGRFSTRGSRLNSESSYGFWDYR